jgi:hypothetical protein
VFLDREVSMRYREIEYMLLRISMALLLLLALFQPG